jgi:hypothetical protein
MTFRIFKYHYRIFLTIALFLYSVNLIAQVVKIKFTYKRVEEKCVFCNKAHIYINGVYKVTATNYPPANQVFRTGPSILSSSTAAIFYAENYHVNCDVCRNDNIRDYWGYINRCYSAQNAKSDKKHDLVENFSYFDVDVEVSKSEIDKIIVGLKKIQDSVRVEIENNEKLKLIKKTEDSLKRIEDSQKQIEAERKEQLRLQNIENQRKKSESIITAQIDMIDTLYKAGKASRDYSIRFIAASKIFDVLRENLLEYNYFYKPENRKSISFSVFDQLLQMAFFVNDFTFIEKYLVIYANQAWEGYWVYSNEEPQFGFNSRFYYKIGDFLSSDFNGRNKSNIVAVLQRLWGDGGDGFSNETVQGLFFNYSVYKYYGPIELRQHLIDVFKYLKTSEPYKELFAKNNTLAAINVALEILEPKK